MDAWKNLKRSVKLLKVSLSGKNKYLDKLINESHYRFRMTVVFGSGWTFVYALYHLILTFEYHSFWFFTMGLYYLTICGMRVSALQVSWSRKDKSHRAENVAVKRNGILMVWLAVVFIGVICLSIVEKRNKVYHTIIAISMAAYTFGYLVIAIINVIQLEKNNTVQLLLMRNTSMACALGSIYGLERMMFGTFGNPLDDGTMIIEGGSGAVIFIVIILLGINLLVEHHRRKKYYRKLDGDKQA